MNPTLPTLSQAIRLGAMLKPQGRGLASAHPSAVATCALAAAREAIGFERHWGHLGEVWPILKMQIACPAGPWKDGIGNLLEAIYRLNDMPNPWTREQIANWVETIEAQQETAPQAEWAALESKCQK